MGVPLVRRGSGLFQTSSPVFLSNAHSASSAPPMNTSPPLVTIALVDLGQRRVLGRLDEQQAGFRIEGRAAPVRGPRRGRPLSVPRSDGGVTPRIVMKV